MDIIVKNRKTILRDEIRDSILDYTKLIQPIASYKIKQIEVDDYNILLHVEKNNEELIFEFKNYGSYSIFCKNLLKQHEYGVLNKPNDIPIFKTSKDRKACCILVDNNFNYIQCAYLNYWNILNDSLSMFLHDKEEWGYGCIEGDLLRIANNYEHNCMQEYRWEKDEKFCQRILLTENDINDKKFAFVRKNTVRLLSESEMAYILTKNITNDRIFSIRHIFNTYPFYEKMI